MEKYGRCQALSSCLQLLLNKKFGATRRLSLFSLTEMKVSKHGIDQPTTEPYNQSARSLLALRSRLAVNSMDSRSLRREFHLAG